MARNGAVVYGHWRSTAYVWCEIRVVVAVDSVSRGYPERVESDADVRAQSVWQAQVNKLKVAQLDELLMAKGGFKRCCGASRPSSSSTARASGRGFRASPDSGRGSWEAAGCLAAVNRMKLDLYDFSLRHTIM